MRRTERGVYLLAGSAGLIVAAWSAQALPGAETALIGCLLGWMLLALAWIDARSFRLPDMLTLPLLLAGLAVAACDSRDALLSAAIGAIGGYAALALISAGYRRLRGRDGLGLGDAKLLAAGGAWIGWAGLPWALLLACLIGIAFALYRGFRHGGLAGDTVLPFGPPLALGIWLVWLYGAPVAWFMHGASL